MIRILTTFWWVTLLMVSCKFGGPETRQVCETDCDEQGAVSSDESLATIDLLSRQDGQKACPVNFETQTFDMTDYNGTANQSFADAAALELYLKEDTGFTWVYDNATCLLSSTDTGAENNTIEIPFFNNSLAGKVFTDLDPANGDFDTGDVGIAGVGVTLTCESYSAQTITNTVGEYSFSNIPPGPCTVSTDASTRPENHTNTYDQDGNQDHSIPVSVGATSNTVDHNFGYIPVYSNTVSGVVFQDAENDLQDLDSPDTGIPDVTVNLVCGTRSFSTFTNASGAYSFSDVPVGPCTLSVDKSNVPSGLTHSYDEDANLDDEFSLSVSPTGAHPGNDFGYAPPVAATVNFINEESSSGATCPLDFGGRTFDMTPFGGTPETLFADAAALETAIEAAPGGFLWVYDETACEFHSTFAGASDITVPLKRQPCAMPTNLSYTLGSFGKFTLNSYVVTPASTDFIVNILSSSVTYDNMNQPIEVGTKVDSYAAGSFSSGSTRALGESTTLPAGTYSLNFATGSCSYSESIVVESVHPFVSLNERQLGCSSISESGTYSSDEKLQVYSQPVLTSSSVYEQTIQVSEDQGVLWINPESYAGGVSFWAAEPGTQSEKMFPVKATAGLMVRNCLDTIGGNTLTNCDTKIIPDPQIILTQAVGPITMSNNASESHICYDPDEDDYQLTIRAYDALGKLHEEYLTPTWKPASSNADLSAAGLDIQTMLTSGASGYQLNYNPAAGTTATRIEAVLSVRQNYDCPNNSLDTSLVFTKNSSEESLDTEAALLHGTSFTLSDAMISSAPTDYILTLYDASGNAEIAFAPPPSGGGRFYDPNLGHYPANTDSTYPLKGGVYYPVLQTASGTVPLTPLCVDEWNMCSQKVSMDYNGKVSSSGFKYKLPLFPGQTSIESIMETYLISDRLVVKDCVGDTIYDTTQRSTNGSPLSASTSLVSPVVFDTSCNEVSVEMIPDPTKPPDTVTVYSTQVGCCESTGPCALPKRDPYVMADAFIDSCRFQYRLNWPYQAAVPQTASQVYCYRSYLPGFEGPSCINPFSSVQGNNFLGLGVSQNFRLSDDQTGCADFGLKVDRSATRIGNKVCVDFSTAAAYTNATSYFDKMATTVTNLEAQALSGERVYNTALYTGKSVLCGDDGVTLWGNYAIRFHPDIYTANPTGGVFGMGQTCLDYDLGNFNSSDPSGDSCLEVTAQPASQLATTALNLFNSDFASSTVRIRSFLGFQHILSSGATADPDDYIWEVDRGIEIAQCTHQNPVQTYTFKVKKSDPSQWAFYRGDRSSTDLIQSDDTNGYLGNRRYLTTANNLDVCGTTRGYIAIRNADGLVQQDIDWANVSCDLSYYGGATRKFLDINQLAAEMSLLTGETINGYLPHNILSSPTNLDNVVDLVCK